MPFPKKCGSYILYCDIPSARIFHLIPIWKQPCYGSLIYIAVYLAARRDITVVLQLVEEVLIFLLYHV